MLLHVKQLAPEIPMPCPEPGCESLLRRRQSRYGLFYGCSAWRSTGCTGGIGCHPDGRSLGVPADKETKRARIEAHTAFDGLWKGGRMSRGSAYRWLAQRMGLREVHMAELDKGDCRRVVRFLEEAGLS